MLQFRKQGHTVISLTQGSGELINPFLEQNNIEAFTHVVRRTFDLWYYFLHLVHFVKFCRMKKVDVVFSHLDPANFVAAAGQYFVSSRVYLCRHHIDEAALYKSDQHWSYRLTNFLARKIIVVSRRAARYMNEVEGVPAGKLVHINLGYDFTLFKTSERSVTDALRSQYAADLLLITVCRLTRFKRPELSVQVLERLRKSGTDARLIILGAGEMKDELNSYIARNGLSSVVSLPGHVGNIMDFIQIADFVLHPSVLESSCVVVKEAGLLKKPVIVCQGIGDFDDYIRHGENGFLVSRENFVNETVSLLTRHAGDLTMKKKIGDKLFDDVNKLFDVRNVIPAYYDLI